MEQQKQEFVAVSAESKSIEIISRKEAKNRGLKRYFTGIPCKNNHISERRVSDWKCVTCSNESKKRSYDRNSDVFLQRCKRYRDNNKDKLSDYFKKHYQANAEKKRDISRKHYRDNREKKIEQIKEYQSENKEKVLGYKRKYKKNNPEFCAIRSLISRVESNWKGSREKCEKKLGYTSADLRRHLESQFSEGMSWGNRSEWHIDHIKPIKAFLDEGVMDIKVINALDNLQPLWASENLSKGAKYHAQDS